jgi:tetratricopeptide (TPR) repeat protein
MKSLQIGLLSLYVLAIAFLGGGFLWNAWQWNWTNLRLLRGQAVITSSGCAHTWLAGMAAGQRRDLSTQHQSLEQALGCSPAYVTLVQAVYPADQELARLAAQTYPASARAWFWLGETLASNDLPAAREAYLHTVTLAPHHALAWCRLGRNSESSGDLGKASAAWLACCLNGDPGKNGCWGAGRMMEQLGNLPQAILYYRLSRWQGALDRAQLLSVSLNR